MYRALWPYLKPYRRQLFWGPLFKLSEAVIELTIPYFLACMIDFGVRPQNPYMIRRYGLIMFLAVCVGVLAACACQYMASVCSQGFSTVLRRELFHRMRDFSQTELDHFGIPSLTNRLTADVVQLQTAVAMFMRLVSRAPFLCMGSLVAAFLINARLALVMLAAVLLASVLLYVLMRAAIRCYNLTQERLDIFSSRLRDRLSGLRVIRAFNRSAHEQAAGEAANAAYTQALVRGGLIGALMNPATSLLFNAAIVLVLLKGGILVDQGGMRQGELVAFVSYLNQIVIAMMVLANLAVLFPRAYSSARRVAEILSLKPVSRDGEKMAANAPPEAAAAGEMGPPAASWPLLRVEGLRFTYPNSPLPTLDGLTLSLRRGERLGVIGSTGSGKSTFAALLTGRYAPTEGEIDWEGRALAACPTAYIRERVALVSQEARLLSGTLRTNLLLGLDPARRAEAEADGDARIWRALETAQAADFVREKGGLDSLVRRGGRNFSGGQRQRLTIARALLRPFDLLILDDETAALDYRTAARLRRAIEPYLEGKALIRISQRVHSLRDADQILVLDDGRVAGLGKHEHLLAACPVYQEICRSQLETETAAELGTEADNAAV